MTFDMCLREGDSVVVESMSAISTVSGVKNTPEIVKVQTFLMGLFTWLTIYMIICII